MSEPAPNPPRPPGGLTRRQALTYGRNAAIATGLAAAFLTDPGQPASAAVDRGTAAAAPDATALTVTTSWTGNTYSGATQWMQDFLFDIAVTADGTVYTASFWDEAHQQAGIYRDGAPIGNCANAIGDAVAVGGTYAYLTVGNGLTRYTLDGTPTTRTYDVGSPPAAAAASATQVVATDRVTNQVKVFDAADGTLVRSWAVNRPGAVALAANGDVWVVANVTRDTDDGHFWHVDTAKPAQILHFSNTGTALGGTIAGPGRDWIPTALAIDYQGNLLVGDNGPHRQVYTYANLSGTPTLARTLGQRGGIGSGTPGQVAPQKLFGIVGVGADQAGNVYVGMHEYGTVLRAFDPAGKLRWELIGRGFVDSADFDPASDGADVHSKQNHYRIDHGKPAGSDATWVGYSLDSVKYPQDPRLFLPAQHHHATSPFLLRRNGSLYMYLTGMYSYHLVVYKFDGEIARPAGMFAKSRWAGDDPAWPPNQPASGEWIWRDTNGNGAFEAGEYSQPAVVANAPSGWVWHVDTNADVWQGGDRLLRRFPLQGYDSHANPVYTYASAVSYPLPAPFTKVMRLHYDPAADVMYLSGYTAAAPYDNAHWKELGRVLARYDRWKTGNRTATWTVDLPWDVTSDPMVTMVGLAVAGEYLFTVGIATRGQVWVWKQSDGSAVGTWQPGANVGGVERTGWVDIPYGVTAMRRSNGDYLVNVEDDLLNKVLLYRWRP